MLLEVAEKILGCVGFKHLNDFAAQCEMSYTMRVHHMRCQ